MSNLVGSTTLSLQQSTPTASAVPGLVNYSFDLQNFLAANGGTLSIQILDLNSSGGVIDQGPGLLQPNVPIDGNWHTVSGSFTAPANVDHFEIQFGCTDAETLLVDNVSLRQVPEPTSLTLAAVGLLGAFLGLRKRQS
ncbi:MAG: PEP-CTERM sorting domain-containing protein [Verrucomicrobiia bacterium]